ncbi:MAG: JAB domain-containing protein [Clostridiaceae bacterium]|nr:JAB domain-containing protein [Clostridiaceae bacterium]
MNDLILTKKDQTPGTTSNHMIYEEFKRMKELISLYEDNDKLYKERIHELKDQLEQQTKLSSLFKSFEHLEIKPLKDKLSKIPCIYELDYNYKSRIKLNDIPSAESSKDIYNLLIQIWSNKIESIEESIVLYLNRCNRVISFLRLSSGGQKSSIVEPSIIFKTGLLVNATRVILSHNHPGGDIIPSIADNELTEQLFKAGNLIGLELFDHLIITRNDFFSYRDKGLLC